MTDKTRGTLDLTEWHPAAEIAMDYVNQYLRTHNVFTLQEALASTGIEGNRMAQVASETLQRVINKDKVSDRYLMGLGWVLWALDKENKEIDK